MKINPISGFPELLPEQQILFNDMIDKIRGAYESAGAVPIATPIVERVDTIKNQGIADKEIYTLSRLSKKDGEDKDASLALRFDLTVPYCRYVAQHKGELVFPFRRYQIQPVWRGERAQHGRYRQFWQADIDIIGDGELGLINDAEIPYIIDRIFSDLEIGQYIIKISNRKLLDGVIQSFGVDDAAIVKEIAHIIDGFQKVPLDESISAAMRLGLSGSKLEKFSTLIDSDFNTEDALQYVKRLPNNQNLEIGIEEISVVLSAMKDFGVNKENYLFDPKIVRGLGYYTGTIYETFLHRGAGLSVCSGGRYENLVSKILGTDNKMPGVGISIGVSRLFSQLWEAGIISGDKKSTAEFLITRMNDEYNSVYYKISSKLRSMGKKVEIYTENRKISQQLKFANKKKIPFVVIAGEKEVNEGEIQIRNMDNGEQNNYPLDNIEEFIK